jgi:hypothetical protein
MPARRLGMDEARDWLRRPDDAITPARHAAASLPTAEMKV